MGKKGKKKDDGGGGGSGGGNTGRQGGGSEIGGKPRDGGPPGGGRGWGPPAGGRGQGPPAGGRSQGPPTGGRGQGPPAEGRGQGPPAGGRGWGPPVGGRGGGPHSEVRGGGPPAGYGDAPSSSAPPPSVWAKPNSPPASEPVSSPPQPKPQSLQQTQPARTSPPQSHSISPSSSSSSVSTSSSQHRIAETTKKMEDISLVSSLQIPKRKAPGSHGRPTNIETNHLALKFKDQNMKIYHYDVDIKPDRPFRMYRKVMEMFRLRNYKDNCYGFDGRKNIFTNKEMDAEKTDFFNVKDDEKSQDHPGIDYTVTVKYANEFRFNRLMEYMKNGCSMLPPQIVIQALDVVLRHAAYDNKNFVAVGRSYFTPPRGQIVSLGDGLNLWYGFYQSAILGWKPFLNVDVAHKGFPEAVNCVESLYNITNCKLDQELDRYAYANFRQYIKGLKIVYQIPGCPNTKRTYKISDLAEPPNRKKFIEDRDGNIEITVANYFARRKNFKLKYPHLPSLQAGSKTATRDCCLPMELCTIVEGQALNKKLNEKQTAVMVRNAARPTYERKQRIMDSVRQINYNQDGCVNQFGITVSSEFEKIPARILPPPKLLYKEPVNVSGGVWNAGRFITPGKLEKWAIVSLDDRTGQRELENLTKEFMKHGRSVDFEVSNPAIELIRTRRGEDIRTPLKNTFDNILKKFGNDVQLIIVVISSFGGDQYGKVKYVAELQTGVLTQCLKSRTVQQNLNRSTVTNILLKVNAKLNGVNHKLDMTNEARFNFLSRPIIIMGADVTHPSPDQTTIPSVAAVTASFDVRAFKYTTEWRLQSPKLEIIEDLVAIVRSLLMNFYKYNKAKPEKIVFYRDGVSEGQFRQVLSEEVQAIRKACKSLQTDYEPLITFLVVQKRHHTRLFPLSDRDSVGKNKNVPAGTVVDQEITHPTEKDFYLNSHTSIQGTSRPTKYHVLWDDADRSMDDLQVMSYYLCHLFTRCTRAVSLPAPTYYAHLAAFRIRAYCEGQCMDLNDFNTKPKLKEMQKKVSAASPMFYV